MDWGLRALNAQAESRLLGFRGWFRGPTLGQGFGFWGPTSRQRLGLGILIRARFWGFGVGVGFWLEQATEPKQLWPLVEGYVS